MGLTLKRVFDSLQMMSKMSDIIRDTHGNVSAIDRAANVICIKPSGMPYEDITQDDLCAVDLTSGVSYSPNGRNPSVDTLHHLDIYRRHPWIGSICHTHSPHVVGWSMTGYGIVPVACTEHADFFGHVIKIVGKSGRPDMENWGKDLVIKSNEKAVILANHGGLTFSTDPVQAVKLAAALENICQKTYIGWQIAGGMISRIDSGIVKKWNERYENVYGQK